MSWEIITSSGQAGPFHQSAPADETGPQVWIRHIPSRALVLGSTQPEELVHRARAEADGVEVCRRRSGGGLVHIDPQTDCWIDLIVPRGSRHWDDDVGRAFHWVGAHWASVLSAAPPPPSDLPIVHRRVERTVAGTVWCFADVGHGEVSIGGSKIVGLSQRRTRTWLRIQTLMLGHWPGEWLRNYVDLERLSDIDPERYPDPAMLDPGLVAAGFPPGIASPDPVAVAERFVTTLPAP